MGTLVEVDRLQPMAASDLESNLNGSSELFSLSNASSLGSNLARIMTRPAALGAVRAVIK